ncbi:MAG: MFS transporter [Gemmatimonadota bacterium]
MELREPAARRILALTSAAHALVHAEMLVFAVVLPPLARELSLSLGELGVLGTLSYACFGAGAPAAGWLADRFGARRVLVACLLGSTAALLGLGTARGVAAVAAGYVALGAAASLYHPAGLGLLSHRVRPLGPALAVHGMAGNAGLAATPFAAAALTEAFGWRAPYLVLSAVALPLALALLSLERSSAPAVAAADREPLARPARTSLVLLLALGTLLGLVYRGTMTFLPIHLLDRLAAEPGDGLARAGLVTSAALLGGMAGQFLAGRSLARWPAETVLVSVLAAAVPLAAGIALLEGTALVAVVFLFVVVHFSHQPLTNTLLAASSRPRVRSRVYGLSFALSFGVGAGAAAAGGALAEAQGTSAVFGAVAAVSVVALGVGLLLRRVAGPDPERLPPATDLPT